MTVLTAGEMSRLAAIGQNPKLAHANPQMLDNLSPQALCAAQALISGASHPIATTIRAWVARQGSRKPL